jgi:hypothetical protein
VSKNLNPRNANIKRRREYLHLGTVGVAATVNCVINNFFFLSGVEALIFSQTLTFENFVHNTSLSVGLGEAHSVL